MANKPRFADVDAAETAELETMSTVLQSLPVCTRVDTSPNQIPYSTLPYTCRHRSTRASEELKMTSESLGKIRRRFI